MQINLENILDRMLDKYTKLYSQGLKKSKIEVYGYQTRSLSIRLDSLFNILARHFPAKLQYFSNEPLRPYMYMWNNIFYVLNDHYKVTYKDNFSLGSDMIRYLIEHRLWDHFKYKLGKDNIDRDSWRHIFFTLLNSDYESLDKYFNKVKVSYVMFYVLIENSIYSQEVRHYYMKKLLPLLNKQTLPEHEWDNLFPFLMEYLTPMKALKYLSKVKITPNIINDILDNNPAFLKYIEDKVKYDDVWEIIFKFKIDNNKPKYVTDRFHLLKSDVYKNITLKYLLKKYPQKIGDIEKYFGKSEWNYVTIYLSKHYPNLFRKYVDKVENWSEIARNFAEKYPKELLRYINYYSEPRRLIHYLSHFNPEYLDVYKKEIEKLESSQR